MAEIWDAYDRQFNRIKSGSLVRGEAIPDGLYHLVCEVIVKHTDGTYLLMQRDFAKPFGGMWELTAGGSALAGETPAECALRELKEETGIIPVSLQEIGRVVHDGHHSLYVEYLCVTDVDKAAVVLQEGETIAYQWVEIDRVLEMQAYALASSRSLHMLLKTSL